MTERHDDLIERLQAVGRRPLDPALDQRVRARMDEAAVGAEAGGEGADGEPDVGPVRGPGRRLRAPRRVAAAVVAAAVVVGGGAAAATGALPGPAQRAAHRILDHVGVHVPDDPGPTAPPPTTGPASPTTAPSSTTTSSTTSTTSSSTSTTSTSTTATSAPTSSIPTSTPTSAPGTTAPGPPSSAPGPPTTEGASRAEPAVPAASNGAHERATPATPARPPHR